MNTMESRHALVEGVVQGVFFRDYTRRQAEQFNLTGWVRNLPNGSVECSFTGEKKAVTLMIEWLWQGSPMSMVKYVIVKRIPTDNSRASFEIRR